jgi:integrase
MVPQKSHNWSHIKRKQGTFVYRRRLPRPHAGEITVSLGTTSFWPAQAMAEALDQAFDLFLQTRPMDIAFKEPLRRYLQEQVKELRRRHLRTPPGQPVHATGVDGHSSVLDADLAAIDSELAVLRSSLRSRDIRLAEPIAPYVLPYRLPGTMHVELCVGILQANIQLLEKSRRWLLEGLIEGADVPKPWKDDATPAALASDGRSNNSAGLSHSPKIGVAPSPVLSEVLPRFIKLMREEKGWRGQTLAQNQTTYRMFIDCCGDRPVSEYERKDLAKFFDLLRALPASYSKSKEWTGLAPPDIVERTKGSDHQRLTMKTMKRHFSALGRLFTYLRRRGEYVRENPAHGFEFPDKRRARDKRKMWDGEPLRRLFASPVWTGCQSESRRSSPGSKIIEDEKYWLPILGLFHGNRLEEFAQLRRADVRCSDGIWFLDINDEGNKQLKNEQSKRRVPIHPRVKGLGFLDYVERVAPNSNDQIFPNLRPGGADNKLGFTFTKWFSRYRQDIGVYEKGLDYHSFRHGVATKLAAAEVPLDARNELLGHEGKSVDERVYQKGLPLKKLAEAVARVEWPEFILRAEGLAREK